MKSSIITLLLCIVAFSNCDPPQAQTDPPEFISECNEFRHGLANPETTPAGIEYSLRKLRQLGCYIPATASAIVPAPLTGPGVCAVYLAKIAALPPVPNIPNKPLSNDYNFYYNVLSTNACKPLPPTMPCCKLGRLGNFFDSPPCASARKEIFSVVPFGERYRVLYLFMTEKHCKDLPASPEEYDHDIATDRQGTCDQFFELISKSPGRDSHSYRLFFDILLKNRCAPLPAPPL